MRVPTLTSWIRTERTHRKMFKWTKPHSDLMPTLAPSKVSIWTRPCNTPTKVQKLLTLTQKSTQTMRQLPWKHRKRRRRRPPLPQTHSMHKFWPKSSRRIQTQQQDYLSPWYNLLILNKISNLPKIIQETNLSSSSYGNKRTQKWYKNSVMRKMTIRTS